MRRSRRWRTGSRRARRIPDWPPDPSNQGTSNQGTTNQQRGKRSRSLATATSALSTLAGSAWRIRTRLVSRYPFENEFARTRTGRRLSTDTPSALRPSTFAGLLVINRMEVTPSSPSMAAATSYFRASSGRPSRRFASTVSAPADCKAYARILLASPIPRPSWRRYRMTPTPRRAISAWAASSCSLQSHLSEPNTSLVRHSLWTRTGTARWPRTSPITSATGSSDRPSASLSASTQRNTTVSNVPNFVGMCARALTSSRGRITIAGTCISISPWTKCKLGGPDGCPFVVGTRAALLQGRCCEDVALE